MKKRLIGSLLMGALLLSSTSVFVSCKDYDDDINKNSSSITALQEQVNVLEKALEQAKADAAAAHAALATMTSLEEEIARLKQELLQADADQKAELEAKIAALENMNPEDYMTKAEADARYLSQTEAANLVTAAALEQALADLKQAIAEGSAEKLNEVANQIAAIDTRLIVVESWQGRLEDLETALPICEQNIANQQKALQQLIDILLGRGDSAGADAVRAALDEIGDEAEGLDDATLDALRDLMNGISDVVDNVAPNANLITALVSHELKSIVLTPEYYIDGIEAITVPSLKNYPLWVLANNEYTPSNKSTDMLNVSLSGTANYHLNPSTANILGYKLSFYGNEATSIVTTRGGKKYVTADSTTITEDYLKNSALYNKATGILTVSFKAEMSELAKLSTDKLPMVALEMTKGDTIVTSDYALVKPFVYKNFVLADKWYLGKNRDGDANKHVDDWKQTDYDKINNEHLHTVWRELVQITDGTTHADAADAIKYAPTVQLLYTDTLDLSERVETHFDYTDVTDINEEHPIHGVLSPANFKALGLRYVYETVTYTVGNNKTDESAHIKVDENGCVVPYSVDESGKPSDPHNPASIGKLPIVRVRLVNNSNQTLAIGYYKIEIVDKAPEGDDDEKAPAGAAIPVPYSQNVYANCQDPGLDWTLTWAQVEALIYSQLKDFGVSKEEFERDYKLDVNSSDEAIQFDCTVSAGKYTYTTKTASNYIGVITEKADDHGLTTSVLNWKIDANTINKWAQTNAETKPEGGTTVKVTKNAIKTYVRYVNQKKDQDLHICFEIPVGKVYFAVGEVTSTKVLGYWYKQFSPVNATGNADAFEVGTGVKTPSTAANSNLLSSTEFTVDLHNNYLNNELKYELYDKTHFRSFENLPMYFELTIPNVDYKNAVEYPAKSNGEWSWTGNSGTEYTLKLNANKSAIQATSGSTTMNIIELNTAATGPDAGYITYLQNDFADDLLNGYSSNGVKGKEVGERQTITAFVKIVVEDGCYPLDLTGTEYFNVRFLRPLNLESVVEAVVDDAKNNDQYVELENLVKVVDWRNYECKNTNNDDAKTINKAFYDMQIRSDAAGFLTDLHLGSDARAAIKNALPKDGRITEKELTDMGATPTKNISGLVLDIVGAKNSTISDPNGTVLRYNYNGSVVGEFHIFVPVYLKYVHAQNAKSWQRGYAVITVGKTQGARQK